MDKLAIIDFSLQIKDAKGEPIRDGINIVTLGEICAQALLSNHEEDRSVSAESKVARYKLFHSIFERDEDGSMTPKKALEVGSEDAALIRKMVNRSFGTLIVGQVFDIIK